MTIPGKSLCSLEPEQQWGIQNIYFLLKGFANGLDMDMSARMTPRCVECADRKMELLFPEIVKTGGGWSRLGEESRH